MKLSQEDSDLFYKLMWRVQYYINQQLQVLPNIPSAQEYDSLPISDKATVRDALWKNPQDSLWPDSFRLFSKNVFSLSPDGR